MNCTKHLITKYSTLVHCHITSYSYNILSTRPEFNLNQTSIVRCSDLYLKYNIYICLLLLALLDSTCLMC
ncbi:hypothetical protein PPL_10525 [Heterostelium album PN500]|uniref:Uncharacterized protein n=1 Tax=Heterostelium pallidum (strain ATCC 26659 / Pp 5 / PN500) TaxID=670386 RepID=D3BRB7_HETP5|nr:hypothetical protein PPL_10525 [Heterostelium album PN500]EFA75949.1 hypothetical protein PPL_10525 [Heterostelium album PN500]|eukprot:XP_020428083.1 hypothetical protein PPL_10525 [Heterostelium album PN500]